MTLTDEQSCLAALVDANILLASAIPECKSVIIGSTERSMTLVQLSNLVYIYGYSLFIPEKLLRISERKIAERCRKEGRKKKINGKRINDATVRATNFMLGVVNSLGIKIIPTIKYRSYLNHPLVVEIGDVNDDNHLIASAFYLRDTLSSSVFVITRDLRIPNVAKLTEEGVIIVSNIAELYDD